MATILDFIDLESKHIDNKSFCKIVYAISHVKRVNIKSSVG